MMKYTRGANGAAILADHSRMQEYMEKKKNQDTIESMRQEINTLKQEMNELRSIISNQRKSE
jgi:cell division protein FtsB